MKRRCQRVFGLKTGLLILAVLGLSVENRAECPETAAPGWYAGGGGSLMLPGHGNTLRRAAAVTVQGGWYVTDFWALELAGMCVPHASSARGGTTVDALSLRGLFHLSGWEAFDKLFGCERFDPFATCGASAAFSSRAAFADGTRRTGIGPTAGIGFFYHLSEHWSVRAEATAGLAVDEDCGMIYAVGIGVQRLFGGGE
jgi:hypothetical protein